MKTINIAFCLLFFGINNYVLSVDQESLKSHHTPPSEDEITRVRKEFIELKRPIGFTCKQIEKRNATLWLTVKLLPPTSEFVKHYSKEALIYGLWGYLENKRYAGDAFFILAGYLNAQLLPGEFPTYKSSEDMGNWNTEGDGPRLIESIKMDCAEALGENENWEPPHKEIFELDAIINDKANREKNITEMLKCLRDPKFRDENPREVENILVLLGELKAKEAVNDLVDFLFYDVRNREEFKLNLRGVPPKEFERCARNSAAEEVSNCRVGFSLAELGDEHVPLVLKKLMNATPQQRAFNDGGGCSCVFALFYFRDLHYTEAQALKAIVDFKNSNPNLKPEQIAALDEIVDIIKNKKYRNNYFRGTDWDILRDKDGKPLKSP